MDTSANANALAIDPNDLREVVCQVLGRADLSVREWAVQPLRYTVRNITSAGLYRLRGTAAGPDTDIHPHLLWSLILKIVQPSGDSSADDPGHWNYWKREALAYQSGLLERLIDLHSLAPTGLAMPRCWKVEEKSDGRLWLWLEDIAEEKSKAGGASWPLERYGLAARHFGLFQSGFLTGHLLPSAPWLSRGWMRARVASFADAMHHLHDPAIWDQPQVQRTCPRALEERLSKLWGERHGLLDALDRLPQTLCHLDVWRPNLLSRTGLGGEQTVVLDWSYVGFGAIGQDIGNLVPDSLGNFDVGVDQARAMDKVVFAGYLQGMREKGWTGDARQARLGYAASAALGWGLGTPWWLVWPQDKDRQAQLERQWGRPLEELLAQRATLTGFVLDLAQEAHELLAQGVV